MGIDLYCLAVPLHAEPVRVIRADPNLWEIAAVQPPFAEPWDDEPLPEISQALLSAIPSGTRWAGHFGDRSQEQAEYLLDPQGYRAVQAWEQREQTLPYRIVNGDQAFADHARSGQGFPWRCSTTAFLTTAVHYIDALDVAAARSQFSVAEMASLGVYKTHPDEDDDQAFSRILARLRAYADYCRTLIDQKIDLIITLE